MIKTWRLARFKSVLDETKLEFAPLTVFAGANSSGKSTIIQSILLTAQTLQSPVVTRPVILNGHMARLGAFPDIVSNADESSSIRIGFELEFAPEADAASRIKRAVRPFRNVHPYWHFEFSGHVDCEFAFGVAGAKGEQEIARLQPALDETRVRVRTRSPDGDEQEEVALRRSSQSPPARAESFRLDVEDIAPQQMAAFTYEVPRLTALSRRRWAGIAEGQRAGATLVHFLPSRIALVFDAVEAEVARTMEFATTPRASARDELTRGGVALNADAIAILSDELQATLAESAVPVPPRVGYQLEQFLQVPTAGSYSALYRTLPPSLLAAYTQRLTARGTELRTAIRGGRASQFEVQFAPMSEAIDFGVEAIQQFFGNNLKYLGPLRDEPKPVYPLAGASDPADVGFRGEYTAAVLDVHRRTEVEYVPSAAFLAAANELPVCGGSLLDAVLDWLEYMGVGSRVHTVDRGKLGHELKIATADDHRLQDLTQVGVGVSQVLPILVLSLLADPGSTLIFEQPELHLHPRVQTRLADFFVAMTRLGKQCIVETHSEYLINRLRFQAAVSKGRRVADAVIMYFVEKEEGRSRYRPVRINEFGVIEDWPRGFFDENEENAAAILRAGLNKRRHSTVTANDASSD